MKLIEEHSICRNIPLSEALQRAISYGGGPADIDLDITVRVHGKPPADQWRVITVETTMAEPPTAQKSEKINHPAHYGGDTTYETIKVLEAWGINDFCVGNCIKYISRAGKKDKDAELVDLKKARWYLDRKIVNLEKEQ